MKRIWKLDGESTESYLKRLEEEYSKTFDADLIDESFLRILEEKKKALFLKRRNIQKNIKAHQ